MLSQYGVNVDELQETRALRSADFDAVHLDRAARQPTKLAQQYLHRHTELHRVRARHNAEKELEMSLRTPYNSQGPHLKVSMGHASLKGGSATHLPTSDSGACVTQAAAQANVSKGPDEAELKALAELDTVFAEHQKDCLEARFSGSRKKENFDLSLNYKDLTDAVFARPVH